jgi:hypothetical protein
MVPSLLRADLDGHERARGVAGAEVLLVAVEHQLDRRARRLREPAGDDREGAPGGRRAELAAEAAAHVLAQHAHVLAVDAERLGDTFAHGEERLRRGVDRELVAFPGRDDAVRLERRVGVDGAVVAALVHDLGLGEALVDVAALVAVRRGPATLPVFGRSRGTGMRSRKKTPGASGFIASRSSPANGRSL